MTRLAGRRPAADATEPPAGERGRNAGAPARAAARAPREPPLGAAVQRKCACHATGARCAACEEEEARRLQRAPAGASAFGDAARVLRSGGGSPLAAPLATELGARFGHDFGGVRVRVDDAAARAVDALAYTRGSEIVFRAGAYAPGTASGRLLLAHELAHVVQQRGGPPRPQRWGDAADPLEREADLAAARAVAGQHVAPLTSTSGGRVQRQAAERRLVADDAAAVLEPGQLRRTEFLQALRTSVCAAAEGALTGTDLTTAGCPYLDRWFDYYSTRSADQLERSMRRYAPESATATTAAEAIRIVSARVRAGVARWAATGDIGDVPPELAAALAGGGLLGLAGTAVSAVSAAATTVAETVTSAVGAVGSAIAGLFGKARPGGLAGGVEPGAVRDRLAGGRPLDGRTRSAMEGAFGMSFAPVRVHTDGTAAELSARLNAHAFTIGTDVAFGAGEYRPGTPAGDVLIAHELAHVAQQARPGSAPAAALEADANTAAGAALLRGRASPSLGAGLQLQSCSKKSAPAAPLADYLVSKKKDAPGETTTIYFDRGSATIDAAESAKIPAIVTAFGAASALTLNAYRSEDEPAALAATRAGSVDAALGGAVPPHTGARTSVPLPAYGVGRIEYRDLRKVDVEPPPLGLAVAPPAEPACAAGPATACGAAFGLAQPRALAMLTAAIGALDPLTPAATTLLEDLFGGPVVGPAAAPTVKAKLVALRTHVTNMSLPGRMRCHNECDAGCVNPAYNTGVGAAAVMTLCPGFLTNPDVDDNAGTLIHEGAHGTTGLATQDLAYGHTRLIRALSPADALRNTDSYVLLVRLLHTPGSVTIGIASDVRTGMNAAEERDAAAALAHLEKWLTESYQATSSTYDAVAGTIAAGSWTNGYYRRTMHLIAPSFPGLTDPGAAAPFALPTFDDQTRLAAIYDRFHRMRSVMWSRGVTLRKIPAGSDRWDPGPGSSVDLTPAFFALPTTTARVLRLLELLATAMPDITAPFVPRYGAAADAIRTQAGLGP